MRGLCLPTGGSAFQVTTLQHPCCRDKFELGSKFDFIYLSYAADILKLRYSGGTEMKKKMKLSKLPRPSFVQFIDYLLRTDVSTWIKSKIKLYENEILINPFQRYSPAGE